MDTVTVRFRGICCCIDLKEGDAFEKRVVLPKHGNHTSMEEHLAVIEFLADDLEGAVPEGMEIVNFTRPGDEGKYQYVQIKEPSCIEFAGTNAGAITPADNLKDAVVSLDSLAPDETLTLKKSLLGPALKVKPALASAVADLPAGSLAPGSFEAFRTEFDDHVPFRSRYVAKSLEHTMKVADGAFALRLRKLEDPNAEPQTIRFKQTTRLVTIANEPLRLIVGHIMDAPAGAAADHFDMYWDLITEPPDPHPLPRTNQGTGPGCAPSTKP